MAKLANEVGEPPWVPKIIGIIKILAVVIVSFILISSFIPRDGGAANSTSSPMSSTGMPPMWPMIPGGWKTEEQIKRMMNSQTRVKDKKDVL